MSNEMLLAVAIEKFANAAVKLAEVIDETDSEEKVALEYPFKRSFDELTLKIVSWKDAVMKTYCCNVIVTDDDEPEYNRKKQHTDAWNGEDIYILYGDKVLLIAEGSGDNLYQEDEDEGYVDYFNLEVYQKSEFIKDPEDYEGAIGGGFMMRTKLIEEELYGKMIDEVVTEVFRCNGDTDAFELYATSKPDYEILN